MFGQTCYKWNRAKNKFDLKVDNPPIILLSTVQMLANPQLFLQNKVFARNSHLLTPHLTLIIGFRSFWGCRGKKSTPALTIQPYHIPQMSLMKHVKQINTMNQLSTGTIFYSQNIFKNLSCNSQKKNNKNIRVINKSNIKSTFDIK